MADLCSRDDVKNYLGLLGTYTADDTLLTGLVTAASSWLEGQVGQPFSSQSRPNELYSGDGTMSLLLRYTPIISVESLTIDGNTINVRDQNNEGWILQDDRLWLSGPSGTGGVTGGSFWPALSPTRMTALRFTVGNANVAVSYTAGFTVIPSDVKQAAIEIAAETYQRKKRLGIMSQNVAGETISYQTLTVNVGLQGVIDRYRTHRL